MRRNLSARLYYLLLPASVSVGRPVLSVTLLKRGVGERFMKSRKRR
ncbi:hypothetical protein Dd703_3899 [Musicola paradisiaca Ech703]|uniref:Uncharacterized protein n=1 Tax=Musicola paradisiaca (strain Ech703) TaxID=579405 RepID=C6C643_MUSP7|nr:hypothetical protein Dd703_3899 [Musicola paradisiaca Ech703]